MRSSPDNDGYHVITFHHVITLLSRDERLSRDRLSYHMIGGYHVISSSHWIQHGLSRTLVTRAAHETRETDTTVNTHLKFTCAVLTVLRCVRVRARVASYQHELPHQLSSTCRSGGVGSGGGKGGDCAVGDGHPRRDEQPLVPVCLSVPASSVSHCPATAQPSPPVASPKSHRK